MKQIDLNSLSPSSEIKSPSNSVPPSESTSELTPDSLDILLAQFPLQDPSPWFITQTKARMRRERLSLEQRNLRWIWSSIAALTCLLFFLGIEIRQQCTYEVIAFSTLDSSEIDNLLSLEMEELWLEQ